MRLWREQFPLSHSACLPLRQLMDNKAICRYQRKSYRHIHQLFAWLQIGQQSHAKAGHRLHTDLKTNLPDGNATTSP
jgi:hypothetical protein